MQPCTCGFKAAQQGTHCRNSAVGGIFPLTLDTESNWPYVRRWQLCLGLSVCCSLSCLFFIMFFFFFHFLQCFPNVSLLAFAFCFLVWTTGLWGGKGAATWVLQFDYTIYSRFFGWVHYVASCAEPQLLLLQKVTQISRVRLPGCSPVINDGSICCCFTDHWELSTSVAPSGAKS